jgi:hypothetical protein
LWFARFTSVKRVKFFPTISTFRSSVTSHTYIISHLSIEEKYCEIAAKRLSQSVMRLE